MLRLNTLFNDFLISYNSRKLVYTKVHGVIIAQEFIYTLKPWAIITRRYYRLRGVIIAFGALLSPPGRYYRLRGVIIALRALLSPSGRYYRPQGVIIQRAIIAPRGR